MKIEPKTKQIRIRVTEQEERQIKQQAKKHTMNISEFIRHTINKFLGGSRES